MHRGHREAADRDGPVLRDAKYRLTVALFVGRI